MRNTSRVPFSQRALFNLLMLSGQLFRGSRLGTLAARLRRSVEGRIVASASSRRGPGRTYPVPRERDLSLEDFKRRYLGRNEPVVLEGAAKDWACCRKWTPEHLSAACGDRDALLVDAEGLSTGKTEKGFELLTVSDLVANIRQGGDKYLRFSPLVQAVQELSEDLNLAWLRERRTRASFGNTYYLFLGGAGTTTSLHSDQPCNLYVQVFGEKRWTLYSTFDTPFMDPEAETGYVRCGASKDLRCVDAYEVTLKPGDILYVPPHMWHSVENLSETIAVGYRFSSVTAALGASALLSLIRLISAKPPLWKTVKYGKRDTNLIWAHASGVLPEVEKALRERERRS